MSSVTVSHPEGNRAIEPRAPFPYTAAPCPLLPGLCQQCHRVPRSNGMGLAGHQGHYYPGVPTTLYYYTVRYYTVRYYTVWEEHCPGRTLSGRTLSGRTLSGRTLSGK